MIVFIIMSYFYKYAYYSVNGVKPSDDENAETHPLTETKEWRGLGLVIKRN